MNENNFQSKMFAYFAVQLHHLLDLARHVEIPVSVQRDLKGDSWTLKIGPIPTGKINPPVA